MFQTYDSIQRLNGRSVPPDDRPVSTPDTKERLLDAAEEIFAEHGYGGTSLRAVTTAAAVNLAAVHYHFGGKRELFQAVFERRVHGLNAERLRRLDELEQRPEPASVEELVEALVDPAIQRATAGDEGWARFGRLIARLNSSGGEHFEAIREVFKEIHLRFFPAFQKALPHLSEAELFWRVHFLLGAMCSLLSDPSRLGAMSGGLCDATNADIASAQLCAFLSAGLNADNAKIPQRSAS